MNPRLTSYNLSTLDRVLDILNPEMEARYGVSLTYEDYISGRLVGKSSYGDVFRLPLERMPADRRRALFDALDKPSGIVVKLAYPDYYGKYVDQRFETILTRILLNHHRLARESRVRSLPAMFFRVESTFVVQLPKPDNEDELEETLVIVREDVSDADYEDIFLAFDSYYATRQAPVPKSVMKYAHAMLSIAMNNILSQVLPEMSRSADLGYLDEHGTIRSILQAGFPQYRLQLPGNFFDEAQRRASKFNNSHPDIYESLTREAPIVEFPLGVTLDGSFKDSLKRGDREAREIVRGLCKGWLKYHYSELAQEIDGTFTALESNARDATAAYSYLMSALQVMARVHLDAIDLSLFCDHYGLFVMDLHSDNVGLTVSDSILRQHETLDLPEMPYTLGEIAESAEHRKRLTDLAFGGAYETFGLAVDDNDFARDRKIANEDYAVLWYAVARLIVTKARYKEAVRYSPRGGASRTELPINGPVYSDFDNSATNRIRLIARDIGIGSKIIEQYARILRNDSRALAGFGWRRR